jgi:hypothetical protein
MPIPTNGAPVAPGLPGLFSGSGPNGWEFNPYGPPVIHTLAMWQDIWHFWLIFSDPEIHQKTMVQHAFSLPI